MNISTVRSVTMILSILVYSITIQSQSAIVEYESTDKGVLIPRMTAAQRNAITSPATGLMVYDISSNQFMYYNSSSWQPMSGGGGITLPYYNETSASGAVFHVQNDNATARYGLAGSVGINAEVLPANSAGVIGHSNGAHGVYGYSQSDFWAGVQGVSNSNIGVGVQGYGFGGGTGGHFYTSPSGVAALTTGVGNVGIGLKEPEHKLHVRGNLFIQTNAGALRLGFPNNGNQWQFNTSGGGADLQFKSKPTGSNSSTQRFRMYQNGEFTAGNTTTVEAWMNIYQNSSTSKPHLQLTEVGNDYARLELSNTVSDAYWQLAGLPSATSTSGRLNFYFNNATSGNNRMTLTGDGKLGIRGTPTARLHVFQASQSVGTGLRFTDNTNNADWDVTHGFALRFHYGGSLRGFINANTGAYTVSSDKRLKINIETLNPVMDKVKQLNVSSYQYINAPKKQTTVGLIAQNVKPLFPELVSYSEPDDLYGINYGGFSVIALKAIQEQQEVIELQQQTITDLEKRMSKFEAMLTAIKTTN